jgi:hypothetical protein
MEIDTGAKLDATKWRAALREKVTGAVENADGEEG